MYRALHYNIRIELKYLTLRLHHYFSPSFYTFRKLQQQTLQFAKSALIESCLNVTLISIIYTLVFLKIEIY